MSSDSDPPLVSLRDRGKRAMDFDSGGVPRGFKGRLSTGRQDDTRASSQETREQSQQLRTQNDVSGVIAPGNDRGYTFAQFVKVKPPTYDGKTDPLVAERWIRKIEGIFRVEEVPEEKKVDFATQYLEGEAEYWWEGTGPALGGRDATVSRKDFVEAFDAQFFPKSFRAKMRSDFVHISQGDSTVLEYVGRFNRLSGFAEQFVASEEDKADHFRRGLRPEIRFTLMPFALTTYKDVLERAIRVEQGALECGIQGGSQPKRPKFTNSQESYTSGSIKRRGIHRPGNGKNITIQGPCTTCGKHHSGHYSWKTRVCFLCGKMGHLRQNCPMQRDTLVDSGSCFICGQPGHLACACPICKDMPSIGRP
ncbi:uncharacterized protein LOC125314297 [Rhodamnia argentea]|uniref:Uncharacterized protein LOC125314297 n=1 Tax=Rhodamnia argentea TaxID=178133 RepID=A0ABM3H6I1_9MYRT|nr:uncharacterized protein LOC125314297 [Rhodamnia argentea]